MRAWPGFNLPGLYNFGHLGAAKVLSGGVIPLLEGRIH